MAIYVYADYSNLWIEGKHIAAVKSGAAPNLKYAMEYHITDRWNIDFGKLHIFAGSSDIKQAKLYGSRPPPNDSIWNAAKRKGFEPIVFDRNAFNKEKKVDTQISTDIMEDSYENLTKGDVVCLIAGDADYVPLYEKLRKRGIRFEVIFWDHAARELKESCDEFTSLNQYFDHLTRA